MRIITAALVCFSLAGSMLLAPLYADDSWRPGVSALNQVDEIDGDLRWGGHQGLTISGRDGRYLLLSTAVGTIRVPERVLSEADGALPQTLLALIEVAQGSDLPTLSLEHHPLTGWRLSGHEVLITRSGVFTAKPTQHDERAGDIEAVSAAAKQLMQALPGSGVGTHARAALVHLLEKLDQPDSNPVSDEINPAYARKVVADGFLVLSLPMLEAEASALTAAVAAAIRLQPQARWLDATERGITHYSDAWGVGSQVYRGEKSVRYAAPAALPMYHWPLQREGGFPQARVIVDLPTDADPVNNSLGFDAIHSASLYHNDTLLASWTAADGLISDMSVWRSVVAERDRRLDENIVKGYMPPHIVIRDGRGHIHWLITAHGKLRPAQDGSREEALRFMDDAAKMLPNAAHLDLISQYLFKYVYDSPDPTMPLLLGNREVKSDIHQTAFETLSTTVGGVCRGDCDDLAELAEHIVDRQGKLGHVISLPGHAALAWAEQEDDLWHVFVLQTGPTLQFTAPRLQDALRATYRSFDASDTFDPNGIGLLLRFSGENTRSAWRLSWRIFAEPEYAATMIDVQKDWHYQTYLQGINKMLELIAAGDEDTANFREMAGLYAFTAQHDKAVEYHRMAMERTDEAESVLLMAVELLYHLNDAERHEEIAEVALDILDRKLPPLREELGQSIIQVGLQLAGGLGRYGHPELAARALRDTIGTGLGQPVQNLARWSQQSFNAEAWMHSPQLRMLDRILGWHSNVLTRIIAANSDGSVLAAVPELSHFLQVDEIYRRYIAFNGSDGGDLSSAYALQGRHLEARWGREELLTRLSQVSLPEERIDHRQRQLPPEELVARDLQWIKASVPFWGNLVMESLEDIRNKALSAEQAGLILPQLEAAYAAAESLGMSGPRIDYQLHFARLVIALLTEDRDGLARLLEHVRDQNDKRLTDNTAQYMGDVAYALSNEWFTTAVEMWRDIVDHKPKYLWIAWRAAIGHAPEKALIAARISAERFADDEAFVAEYEFMRQLLTPNL
ncbi:MAG: hypothetical protein EA402_10245 [Planctomycetota bacterium]|nr:MAG: hypothetical protein EA402_10245 [Planctomycetota bacterium]